MSEPIRVSSQHSDLGWLLRLHHGDETRQVAVFYRQEDIDVVRRILRGEIARHDIDEALRGLFDEEPF